MFLDKITKDISMKSKIYTKNSFVGINDKNTYLAW